MTRGRIVSWTGAGLVVALALLMFRVRTVEGEAMRPSLRPADRIVVERYAFDARLPFREEIVVARVGQVDRVLRVIGIGGDTVELKRGDVYLHGARVAEPYRTAPTADERKRDEGVWRVPGGTVFLLGDNRASAEDSRHFGCVPVGDLRGLVLYRLTPASRRGWF
jgi:signal peptidase I